MPPDARERRTGLPAPEETDAAYARAALRAHGKRVRRRTLQRAFDRLDGNGSLTPAQRRAVEAMAAAVAAGVLDDPTEVLARDPDPATVRTALSLFDLDR